MVDGYERRLIQDSAFLDELERQGEGVPGFDVGKLMQSTVLLSKWEIDYLMEHNGLVNRVVRLIPEKAMRKGYEIILKDVEENLGNKVSNALEDLKFDEALTELGIQANAYGGAAILIYTEGNEAYDTPLKEGSKIVALKVVTRHDLKVLERNTDLKSPNIGNPEIFLHKAKEELDSNDLTSILKRYTGEEDEGVKWHASRMITMVGVKLPRHVAKKRDFWGGSLIQLGYNELKNLMNANPAISDIVQSWTQKVFKIDGFSDMMADKEQQDAAQTRVDLMAYSRAVLNVFMMDTDEEMIEMSKQTTGLPELYKTMQVALASAYGIPVTALFMDSPGGLSSGDQPAETNLNELVMDAQKKKFTPAYKYMVSLVAQQEGVDFEKWMVIAFPLKEVNKKEESETLLNISEASRILLTYGVVSRLEIRNSLFGDGTALIKLIESDVPSLTDPEQIPDYLNKKESPKAESGLESTKETEEVNQNNPDKQNETPDDKKGL